MEALKEARAEAATIAAKLRVRKAMLAKEPRNVDLVLKKGYMVRLFRKNDNGYTGPYLVARIDGTQVFVIVKDLKAQHNLDQFIPAAEYDRLVNGDKPMEVLFTVTKQFRSTKPNPKTKRAEVLIHGIIRRMPWLPSVRRLKTSSNEVPGKWS